MPIRRRIIFAHRIHEGTCMSSKLRTAAATLLLFVLANGDAGAQMPGGEACKAEKVSPQKQVDFLTAFTAADKRAKAWQPDAVVARLTHTSLGPIDAEGRSSNWYMVFYSPGKKASDMITIADGSMTCWWTPGPAGRLPELKPDFYRDVKTLLAEASAHGGAPLMAEGYLPTLELSAGSKGRSFWYVNYGHPQKRGSLQVTFDANSGKFNQAIK
jgi:hypothetical protein